MVDILCAYRAPSSKWVVQQTTWHLATINSITGELSVRVRQHERRALDIYVVCEHTSSHFGATSTARELVYSICLFLSVKLNDNK